MHRVAVLYREHGADKWSHRAGIGSAVTVPTMLDRLHGDLQEVANAIAHRHGSLDDHNRPLSIHVRDDGGRAVFSVYVTGISMVADHGRDTVVSYSQGWLGTFSVYWGFRAVAVGAACRYA